MRRLAADLHVHTALSPCADPSMTPERVVAVARLRGLDMIAVCDHNSAGNVRAVQEAAARGPAAGAGAAPAEPGPAPTPAVLPGIEITTREEVHVLGLFPAAEAAVAVGEQVLATLPEGSLERGLLSAASGFSLSEAVELIHEHGGLAVAAHVDRQAFSVLGQLGFLPEEPRFDAAEVSAAGVARGRAERYRELGLPLVCGSDSHFPDDLGSGRTVLEAAEASFAELALALRGLRGRRCGLA